MPYLLKTTTQKSTSKTTLRISIQSIQQQLVQTLVMICSDGKNNRIQTSGNENNKTNQKGFMRTLLYDSP